MAIKIGDKLPAGTLWELIEEETPGCSIGPNSFKVEELVRGKRIAIFGLPGAFTPTCSARHLPGYIEHAADFKGKGVADVVCLSVNDAFVMNAWSKDQNAAGKVTMVADGNGEFTKKMGLEMDASKFGMGLRSQRYAMLVDNGVVKKLEVEEPGAFKVSSADHMLGLV